MNTLTIIELSESPDCELTAQAFLILQRADVLICDSSAHAPYLNMVTDQCFIIHAEHISESTSTLKALCTAKPHSALTIVILCNQEATLKPTMDWVKDDHTLTILHIKETSVITGGVDRLTQLPIQSKGHESLPRLLLTAAEWTDEFERVRSKASIPLVVLIIFDTSAQLTQLVQRAIKTGQPTTSTATHITFQPEPEVVTYRFDALPQTQQVRIRQRDILIFGPPLDLDSLYDWCAHRPLLGRRFMITRAPRQQKPIRDQLSSLGAQTTCLALSEFQSIQGPTQTAMYNRLSHYQWLILTSVNAVHFFFEGLERSGAHISGLSKVKVACVGPVTTAVAQSFGLTIDLEPTQFTSEGLSQAFAQCSLKNANVLLPRAEVARSVLPEMLHNLGADVDVVATYRQTALQIDHEIWRRLNALSLDGVLFCASSAVLALENWIDKTEETSFKSHVPAFCIGPSTRQTALDSDYGQVTVAVTHTVPGLIDCVARYYSAPR